MAAATRLISMRPSSIRYSAGSYCGCHIGYHFANTVVCHALLQVKGHMLLACRVRLLEGGAEDGAAGHVEGRLVCLPAPHVVYEAGAVAGEGVVGV